MSPLSPIHESNILSPRDPAMRSSDDWPIYTLKNATVFDPLDSSRTPINLLHAGAYKPLTVSGKLDSPPPTSIIASTTYGRSQPVEVTGVTQFSYGQYEDGSVEIWAAGQAGWFTIVPARGYKDVYVDMEEAVQLLYFISDAYKEVRKPSDLAAQAMFALYRKQHAESCVSSAQAEDVFKRHRYFLFASMLDGKEDVLWRNTPLFKYYETRFADDVAIIRKRRAFAMQPPKVPTSKHSTQSPAPSTSSLKRKRREREATPSSVVGSATGRRSKSRSVSVATTATSGSVMESRRARASSNRPQSRRSPRLGLDQTQPRDTDTPGMEEEVDDSSSADSDDSVEELPVYRGKTRSSLRPKSAKYINARQATDAVPGDGNEADDDETETDLKGPVQASPSSKRKMIDDLRSRRAKRRNSEMRQTRRVDDADEEAMIVDADDDDDDAGRSLTPTNPASPPVYYNAQDDQERADSSISQSSLNSSDVATKPSHNNTPDDQERVSPSVSQIDMQYVPPTLAFRFRTDQSDGEEDNGDVWHCPTDGCMHRVYAASEPASQAIIADHQRSHTFDDDQRVQLVRRMQAPWLPVSRLMGRVRELAAQSGTPTPVVQRY
ncbi:hypothetical protein AAFC00_003271 [Neodothiora populina]